MKKKIRFKSSDRFVSPLRPAVQYAYASYDYSDKIPASTNILLLLLFCSDRAKFDGGGDEFLMESVDENMVREWRRARNTPWSYSRISRIFKKSAPKRPPAKSSVSASSVNVHDPGKSKLSSASYGCRTNVADGRYQNDPKCPGNGKNRSKRSKRVRR